MTESVNTQQQTQFNILVIGDICIDEYHYGSVTRISPEAPVPVFQPTTNLVKEGMADNVRRNLEALRCKVKRVSNTDSNGKITKKMRYIDEKSKQHIIRIDEDRMVPAIPTMFITKQELDEYDAVVISDYNKGVVTYELVEWLRKEYQGPIFIDTKKTDLARFNGCYVKINKLERSLAETLPNSEWLIVTHGEKGAMYNGQRFDLRRAENVIDVCGAGDTFLSALTYKFIETQNIQDAIVFANKAAAITVQHIGVYSPMLGEIV